MKVTPTVQISSTPALYQGYTAISCTRQQLFLALKRKLRGWSICNFAIEPNNLAA